MAEPVGALRTELSANVARYERDLNQARKATQDNARKMGRSFKLVQGNADTFIGSLSTMKTALAGIATGATVVFLRNQLKTAATLQDTADKIGLNVETLQEYRFAAEQVGVSQQTLDLSLQRFTRRLGEAVQGGGELKDVLEQYDIAVKNADGSTRSTEDVLGDLAEATKNANSANEQLRISFKAFDSDGAALVNLMRRGRDGIDAFAKDAREAGIILGEDLTKQAQRASRELDRAIKIIQASLTANLLPYITAAVVGFQRLFNMGRQNQLRTAIEDINEKIDEGVQKVSSFERRFADLQGKLQAGTVTSGAVDQAEKDLQTKRDDLEKLRKRELALRQELIRLEGEEKALAAGGTPGALPPTKDDRASADRAKEDVKERLKKLDALKQEFLDREAVRIFESAAAQTAEGKIDLDLEANVQDLLDGVDKAKERSDRLKTTWEEIDDEILASGADLIGGLVAGTYDWRDALGLVLKEAIEIVGQLAKASIGDESGLSLGGTEGSAGSSIFGSLLNVGGSLLGSFLGFEKGGIVPGPVGAPVPAIVHGGEEIIPASEVGDREAGNTYYIDARGAQRGVSTEVMQAIRRSEDRAVVRSVGAVKEKKERGGSYARTFEG